MYAPTAILSLRRPPLLWRGSLRPQRKFVRRTSIRRSGWDERRETKSRRSGWNDDATRNRCLTDTCRVRWWSRAGCRAARQKWLQGKRVVS
ncbi:hypothetical protein IE81DRAFT_240152 [Ceraceosorus guamensis]|uniref:Uncharacterized protein n=1 Tax=Ceraceosorus guamensis TaxID=1522189 RepID=A0A316W6U1_9BASI|nr:hypothetical protein IE81DRAFT_240152 [Ceraceosorus guamensis]PWN44838.1 hypothetical protein IE81DRAFT_240152 [Ceraceosorus guamensis]